MVAAESIACQQCRRPGALASCIDTDAVLYQTGMKSISQIFRSRRQQELSNFFVYILEDGPADGQATVRCVALDGKENVLRCGFLAVNAETSEYALTVLLDVYSPLRSTEFDMQGTVGGLKCVIGIFDHEFLKVTGTPDANIFRTDRQKAMHFGHIS
jgi:hypothetical protein